MHQCALMPSWGPGQPAVGPGVGSARTVGPPPPSWGHGPSAGLGAVALGRGREREVLISIKEQLSEYKEKTQIRRIQETQGLPMTDN